MAKLRQETDSCRKVRSVQKSLISAIRPSSDGRNSEITDRFETDNEPLECGESCLMDSYSVIREFQFILTSENLISMQLLFCPKRISEVSSLRKILYLLNR
jgi:hypothetical protein